jgi:hypothetical protein
VKFSDNFSGEAFFEDVRNELELARRQYPNPNPTLAALTEQVGELSQAMFQIRNGVSKDWFVVWFEAKQVAVMAARCAIEGDPTVGAVPTARNYE